MKYTGPTFYEMAGESERTHLRSRVLKLEAGIRGALRSRDRREPVDFEALEALVATEVKP